LEEERELRWQDRLTAILLPAMQHAIEQRGIDASGAYNFYARRVEQQKVFLEYEVALAQRLLSCELGITQVHEVGCGYGQLVFLLGWNGFQAVGFELDQARGEAARALWGILKLVDPELSRNITLVTEAFPSDKAPPVPASLVLTTNLVAQATPQEQLAVARAMRRYRYALVDVQRFFEYRPEIEREPEALALFTEAGFAPPQLFLDLGAGGRYYLFEGDPQDPGKEPTFAVGIAAGLCA
jgi:SAM-dependent methyltransferase